MTQRFLCSLHHLWMAFFSQAYQPYSSTSKSPMTIYTQNSSALPGTNIKYLLKSILWQIYTVKDRKSHKKGYDHVTHAPEVTLDTLFTQLEGPLKFLCLLS